MNTWRSSLQRLFYYPSAVLGAFVVFLLVFTAIYAMVKIPYREAIRLWRGGEEVWYQNPKFAPPAWINLFSSKKYVESFAVKTSDGSLEKTVVSGDQDVTTYTMNYSFDFDYDYYPQEMIVYVTSTFAEKQPFISLEWLKPDGETVRIANLAVGQKNTYRFSQDEKLQTKLRTQDIIPVLFSLPEQNVPAKGTYQLLI